MNMEEIVKHINDTNASYRSIDAGDAKNTDLFLDNEHYSFFEGHGDEITVRFDKENLQKAILFIASILPRKFDCSTSHYKVSFSTDFVKTQLAILDGVFTVDGISVEKRTQKWKLRKDVPKKNGEIDNRFYFNGLIEKITYTTSNGLKSLANFTIRNYMAGGYSSIHFIKSNDVFFDVRITNALTPTNDGKERGLELIDKKLELPLQQIFYGAPGTGKSHTINVQTQNEDVIRTTFHPDSDYSTFVGAYKPSTINAPVMTVIGTKAVQVENADGSPRFESKIIYEYVEQAFLQAYVSAWKKFANPYDGKRDKQYLVIEEINRGNCAQIFGDLFQLLDRNVAGFSDYPIKADTDLSKQLKKLLDGISFDDPNEINQYYKGKDIASKVLEGEILLLPNNLYIWATMNTSDQSLFPIDSAFKRRWDWQYIPIDKGYDEYGFEKKWSIDVAGKRYDWWSFLNIINDNISTATSSEDKQLGFYFCKAVDDVISAEKFVSKVIFYLWNDVYKDYESNSVFGGLKFRDFYRVHGNQTVVNSDTLQKFFENIKLSAESDMVSESSDIPETENVDNVE